MNTAKIKAYAPRARKDFIQAVTDKANIYGLSAQTVNPAEIKGDIAIIAGRAYPKKIGGMQQRLINRIQNDGFEQVMESIAYTWFNRFMALRYMEIHDYLDHGYRVLSNRGKSDIPEILEQAANVDLPDLDKDKVVKYRLAGDKDNELYQMLILAQCHALHRAMPFLFEPINNETELLIPDNLLYSNSPIRKLVNEIDESEWNNVEIIGWLYQFYISEKKAQVIGKVVKSEDIPAATQLFTPNWIVKYMVQNTLGRMWLATYPDSPLKDKMEYYIEPAEQEPEVQAVLDRITPKELNPEEITFLDPACGSGHILVEAYNIFKEIYLERGYRTRDIPRVILEKNLYGLDIDDRAAQLAYFALLMRAKQDDRRILACDDFTMNVMAVQESKEEDSRNIETLLDNLEDTSAKDELMEIINVFKEAKTFGSLIKIPENIAEKLEEIEALINQKISKASLFINIEHLAVLIQQAKLLSRKYDCVVTNPPYMGNGGMNPSLKTFAKKRFPISKTDLFAMFMEYGFYLAKPYGYNAQVNMQSWMFLSSFEKLRKYILQTKTFITMAHLGARAFGSISGEVVQTTSFIALNLYLGQYKPIFFRLIDGGEEDKRIALIKRQYRFNLVDQEDFKKIPGSPIVYWSSNKLLNIYKDNPSLGQLFKPRAGTTTTHNGRFLRYWFEVSKNKIFFNCPSLTDAKFSQLKWFPYNKGGGFRRYYGNNEYVINWLNDGEELKHWITHHPKDPSPWSRYIRSIDYYFQAGITWGDVCSAIPSFRWQPTGYIAGSRGPTIFTDNLLLLSYLNSYLVILFLQVLNPTLTFNVGDVAKLPIKKSVICDHNKEKERMHIIQQCINISKQDWDNFETSWDFETHPFLYVNSIDLIDAFNKWKMRSKTTLTEFRKSEEENNNFWILIYGLENELSYEIPENQIKLTRVDRKADIKRLISYSIGCMMGRYSLDHPGLIYAHSGNIDFDPIKYKTFPADDDGIIPIMDQDWFPDDATSRFCEFIKVAWSPDTYDENMKFIADSLSPKKNETPIDTIRRYLSTEFFKDHIKTYKKRPIYWLFSSGKQKAFECLVYLHRYNESTLARMRNAYVTPLQGKFNARIGYLQTEIEATESLAAKKRLQKELEIVKKKKSELAAFDDELRHYADMRISIDLDDGVKVNYGKFGKLLAEQGTITGE